MGDIVELPPRMLSNEQVIYWQQQLENAERAREYALKMLGQIGVENGNPKTPA